MNSSISMTNVADVIVLIERKAHELEDYAEMTTSRIARAVSQGQAQILRELAVELGG